MPTTMNQAMFDPEMDSITQARLYAKSLRDSTQKNIDEGKNGRMVGPYWIANDDRNDLLKQGMAGGLEYVGGQAATNLGAQRDAEFKTALSNRPDMMEDRTTPGTPAVTQEFPGADAFGGEGSAPVTAEVTPEVLPMTKRVMKPYQQQQQEQIKWATDMASLKHPMAQSLAAQGMKEAWDIPEKGMAREELAVARQHEKELQHAKELENIRVREQERRISAAEAQKEREAADMRMKQFALANRVPAPAQIITTDQGIFERTRDGKLVQLQSADGKPLMKPGGAGARGKNLEGKLETAHSLLDGLKAAKAGLEQSSGVYDVVPAGVRQYFTSSETKAADASVSSVAAEKAHELFGSAFTASEQSRASEFLPAKGDTIETKRSKLDVMEKLVEKKIARLEGKPDPHPDMYATYKINPVLDEDVDARKSALPASTAAVTGTPRSFATEADAAAAKLKKGTPVVINGVKGTWQ